MFTADTLSRAPVTETGDGLLQEDVEGVTQMSLHVPATPARLERYRLVQEEDPVCSQVWQYCTSQWPPKKPEISSYYQHRSNLTLCDNLLMYNNRIVVPIDPSEEKH